MCVCKEVLCLAFGIQIQKLSEAHSLLIIIIFFSSTNTLQREREDSLDFIALFVFIVVVFVFDIRETISLYLFLVLLLPVRCSVQPCEIRYFFLFLRIYLFVCFVCESMLKIHYLYFILLSFVIITKCRLLYLHTKLP